jgi:hypothetical protein
MRRVLRRPGGDDGFAMVISLLLIMVVATLSLAMAAVVLNQVRPTQQARKSVQTVNAAQSGVQVALSNLRAANDGGGNGVLSKLCTASTSASFSDTGQSTPAVMPGVTYSGAVTTATGTGGQAYRVSVAYFSTDPSGKSLTWLAANRKACPLTAVPSYAYIQAYGLGSAIPGSAPTAGNRVQVGTYKFSTSNINIVGGRMRSYGTQQCLDAGSSPAVGTTLTLQPCLAPGTPSQTWQYRQDLTIFYGGDTGLNLCIQAPASGILPLLKACTGSGSGSTYPYAPGQQVQEWGFNDNGHFSAALAGGTVTNGTGGNCLQPQGATSSVAAPSGAPLIYTSCDATTTGPAAFDPDATVGAGKAGGGTSGVPGATKQFVSYAQFGRCLDITGQNVNADHLIAYPCKQAPNSSTLTFNQVWTYTVTSGGYGIFSVTTGGINYCLTAPTSGNLVRTTACLVTPSASQLWQATGNISGNYAGSYTLVSKPTGSCLAVSPLSESLTNGSSNITVATCDGSNSQKWNAPPVDPNSLLSNVQEPANG